MALIQVSEPIRTTPHLKKVGICLRCADNASKYNHCTWCGDTFRSFTDLTEHWKETSCGTALIGVLRSHNITVTDGSNGSNR